MLECKTPLSAPCKSTRPRPLFPAFNARSEHGSAFNRQFFANGKLWLALIVVVGLQVLVVHWGPAQTVFDTVDLPVQDWGLAVALASSVLLLEEARKFLAKIFQRGNLRKK